MARPDEAGGRPGPPFPPERDDPVAWDPCAASSEPPGWRGCLSVLLQGLERLEYRGYDSAGVALQSDREPVAGPGRHRDPVARGPPQGRRRGPGRGDGRASATPGGPPTAIPPRPTPTPSSTAPATSPSCTTASSRTGGSWPSSCATRATCFVSDTDTEVIAHLVERSSRAGSSLADAVRATLREVRGAFALAVIVRGGAGHHRGRHAGCRRSSSAWATATAGRGPARLGHPRPARPHPSVLGARRRPGRRAAARVDARDDLAGQGGRAQRAARRLGPRGGREGRLPRLHGQGDPRAAPRHRRHPARSAPARRHGRARRAPDHRRRAAARSTRSSWWPAVRATTPAWWPSTPSSAWPGCPPRSTSPRSSVTATPCSTSGRSWSG